MAIGNVRNVIQIQPFEYQLQLGQQGAARASMVYPVLSNTLQNQQLAPATTKKVAIVRITAHPWLCVGDQNIPI